MSKSDPSKEMSYAETHYGDPVGENRKDKHGKTISTKMHLVPKGGRTNMIFPIPPILKADGMTEEEWELLINMPLWQLREIVSLSKLRKNQDAPLQYPLDKNVPPPPFIGRFGRPSKGDQKQFQADADFQPPFGINAPRPAWPFKQMEPGDSFVAPKHTNVFRNMSSYTRAEQERGRRVVFTSRAINQDWVRVWCLWDTYDYDNDGLTPPGTGNKSALQDAIEQANVSKKQRERETYNRRKAEEAAIEEEAYDPKKVIIAGISDYMFLELGADPDQIRDPQYSNPKVRTMAFQMMSRRAQK